MVSQSSHAFFTSALPPYVIRKSTRAQRIILRILSNGTLEVVIPTKTPDHIVPEAVARMRPWIIKHIHKLMPHSHRWCAPFSLQLYGGREHVTVWPCAQGSDSRKQQHEHNIYLPGSTEPASSSQPIDVQSTPLALRYLRDWIKNKARRDITPLVAQLARQYDLPYGRLSFRLQKSRWGSCSAQKNLSLNAGMIFLPQHLLRHVIIHELCHTKILNHSAAFHKLVHSIDPNAQSHARELRLAWKSIPCWAVQTRSPNS